MTNNYSQYVTQNKCKKKKKIVILKLLVPATKVGNVPILHDKNEIGSGRVKEDGPLKRLDLGLCLVFISQKAEN